MKKALLVFVAMFTCVAYAEVEISSHTSGVIGFGNPRSEAVSFYRRGIQFHVYLNGDFDFDSRYLRARRNWRVPVSRDYRGRINRIGNVWVRYDSWGNVRRIGRVSMSYRRGWLQRVGNLRIQYNRWGIPNFYGSVGFDDFYVTSITDQTMVFDLIGVLLRFVCITIHSSMAISLGITTEGYEKMPITFITKPTTELMFLEIG